MEKITEALYKINLNSLITIFDIQIALAVVIVSLLFRGVLSKFILKIVYLFTKQEQFEVKKSKMYNPLKRMFFFIGIYIALRVAPTSAQITYYTNEAFKVIVIIFITQVLTSIMTKDSKIFKKILNLLPNT